jgi:O-antigen/teichoic acid export membrane protein
VLTILQFFKRPFIRNLAAVASGAAASQAITMAFAPLVTRLYGPEAYGIQGVFMSIAGVMGAIAALIYPVAIVLPRHASEAVGLARLSFYIGIVMSLLTSVILFFFGSKILSLLQAEEISAFIYFIPAFMIISVVNMVLSQWLIRKKAFNLTAKVTVLQAFLVSAIKTGVGFVLPTAVMLIITNVLGGLVGALMMLLGLRMTKASREETKIPALSPSTWELAKTYRDFPLFRAPQELLNSVSYNLPIMLLASYYGPVSVGYYSIASAVLGIPMGLIGRSVMQVFYPRITEAIHSGENAKKLIIKATLGLAVSGAPLFIIVILAGPKLFGFVFGSDWHMAGVYAQWLSIWLFLQYINKPAVAAIPALRLQGGLLMYEVFSTGTKILALYLGYNVYNSDIAAISLFSVFGSIAYVWLILWVIYHSGKVDSEPQLG